MSLIWEERHLKNEQARYDENTRLDRNYPLTGRVEPAPTGGSQPFVEIELITFACPECGGTGIDPGGLSHEEPEMCPECFGYKRLSLLPEELPERKPATVVINRKEKVALMEFLRFEPNTPVRVAFKCAGGRESQSRFGGTQFYRSLCDGRGVYLQPFVEHKLVELDIRPDEPVSICKREKDGEVRWEIERAGHPEKASPAQSAVEGKATNQSHSSEPVQHTRLSACLAACLKTAIDAVTEANEYATRKNLPIRFNENHAQAFGTTIFIQTCKELNIGAINRREQFRTEQRTGQWAH